MCYSRVACVFLPDVRKSNTHARRLVQNHRKSELLDRRFMVKQIPKRSTAEHRHSRLIGLLARVTMNRYVPGSGMLCLSQGVCNSRYRRIWRSICFASVKWSRSRCAPKRLNALDHGLRARAHVHTPDGRLRPNYRRTGYTGFTATSMEYLPRKSLRGIAPRCDAARRTVIIKGIKDM